MEIGVWMMPRLFSHSHMPHKTEVPLPPSIGWTLVPPIAKKTTLVPPVAKKPTLVPPITKKRH
jgi:hypothetical protein